MAWRKTGKSSTRITHQSKEHLESIWLECAGVVHSELLPINIVIPFGIYHQQLDYINAALKEKRPGLIVKV